MAKLRKSNIDRQSDLERLQIISLLLDIVKKVLDLFNCPWGGNKPGNNGEEETKNPPKTRSDPQTSTTPSHPEASSTPSQPQTSTTPPDPQTSSTPSQPQTSTTPTNPETSSKSNPEISPEISFLYGKIGLAVSFGNLSKPWKVALLVSFGAASIASAVQFFRRWRKPQELKSTDEPDSFNLCFDKYGGSGAIKGLKNLSTDYNTRSLNLKAEEKLFIEAQLKQIQLMFETGADAFPDKGKAKIDEADMDLESLLESSLTMAAHMGEGYSRFTVTGLHAKGLLQTMSTRLECMHFDGINKLSEYSAFGMSNLANFVIEDSSEGPHDNIAKAKMVLAKARIMIDGIESITETYIRGLSSIATLGVEKYLLIAEEAVVVTSLETSILEKARALINDLKAHKLIAMAKIQECLHLLSLVIVAKSL